MSLSTMISPDVIAEMNKEVEEASRSIDNRGGARAQRRDWKRVYLYTADA